VTNRDLQIEASQGCYKGRGGVAVDEYHVWLDLLEDRLNPIENIRRYIKQRLPILHDVEIVVRDNTKGTENLIQHLTVLGGYTDDDIQGGTLLHL